MSRSYRRPLKIMPMQRREPLSRTTPLDLSHFPITRDDFLLRPEDPEAPVNYTVSIPTLSLCGLIQSHPPSRALRRPPIWQQHNPSRRRSPSHAKPSPNSLPTHTSLRIFSLPPRPELPAAPQLSLAKHISTPARSHTPRAPRSFV